LRGFLPERKLFFHIQQKQKFTGRTDRTYSTKYPKGENIHVALIDRRIYLSLKNKIKTTNGRHITEID
jgi:hypothetical protein